MPRLTEYARRPWPGGNRLRNANPCHERHEPGVINAV